VIPDLVDQRALSIVVNAPLLDGYEGVLQRPEHQRAQRWLQAGVFEAAVHDPRALSRGLAGRAGRPPTVVLDGRTPPSPPATVEGPPLVALATLMGHEAVALLAQVPNIL
jgi:hypothetical protein